MQFVWLSFKMVGLYLQWWVSKVASNFELVYIVTILPAISLIPCKITVLAVLGFLFFFLYQKLSLFTGTFSPMHSLFHPQFHNSFKCPHFILHSSQCFLYLSSSIQFTTTATFGSSPCTYSFPNRSFHFRSVTLDMVTVAVWGNWQCISIPSTRRILFMYYVCAPV
jgi:hypothetical protein